MSSVSNSENLSPQVLRTVAKQLHVLQSEPPEGIKIFMNEGDLTDIQASIEGPLGTPYEGGSFKMKLVLGKDYPQSPPRGYFLTKIFHPNVSKNGEICVNTLKKDWKADLGLKHILITVKCLLIYPNPESALNEEAGKLLLEQYSEYSKQAKMMTEIYARSSTKTQSNDNGSCSSDGSSSSSSSKNNSTSSTTKVNNTASKKRAAEKVDKKKQDKKRALKRL
ncbi:ubiquitin-conjugating enzyme E2 S-like [Clytia hemisphaerica]|uniref:E2 ubiquitin-conjugating enzyme n=1 Tax=Clytia hemisphaerica TaxID=252671 RepID=A0A7M5XHZ5_9CNID|eukprot:TCONS_00032905-protein